MKQIKYILLVLTVVLVGCESFLDKPPLDKVGVDSYWKTAQDLESYVIQYYPLLPSHRNNDPGMAYEERHSDNMILAVANPWLNGETTINSGHWAKDWASIRSVNTFFDNYKKCTDNFNLYKHYLGEAYFFRAYFYFNMVKKWGDVPWYNTALFPNSEKQLMRPRDARTLVVDSIISDLDKATLYLNKLSANSEGNNRLSAEAALAFKSRVALHEGTWQKYHAGTAFATKGADPEKYFRAAVAASEALMNGEFKKGIYSTGHADDDYFRLFGMSDMGKVNEVLFYSAYNSGDGWGHNVQHYATVRPNQMGLTWDLVSSYLGKDGQVYDYKELAKTSKGNAFLTQIATDCDPRLKSTVWIPGDMRIVSSNSLFEHPAIDQGGEDLCTTGFQVKKFANPASSAAGAAWGGYSETGYIHFRYAEVLLNYAEAKYELDATVAVAQLNLLRQRVGMPDFSVSSQNDDPGKLDYGYAVSDELYSIRRERRVELALEGHRGEDIKRWAAHKLFKGKRLKGYPFDAAEFPGYTPPLDENNLIDYLKKDIPKGYGFREKQDYLSSIPLEEITLNPNLNQNPGWTQ